jgi:hypothetical protein
MEENRMTIRATILTLLLLLVCPPAKADDMNMGHMFMCDEVEATNPPTCNHGHYNHPQVDAQAQDVWERSLESAKVEADKEERQRQSQPLPFSGLFGKGGK